MIIHFFAAFITKIDLKQYILTHTTSIVVFNSSF